MRVALVHMRHAATGGTERYLNGLAAHLAEAGHDVTIVCRRHEQAPHPAVRFHVLHRPAIGSAMRMLAFARSVEAHVRTTRYDVVYGLGKTWSQDVIRLGGGCHASYLEHAHAATLQPWQRVLGGGRMKHRLALEIERRALAPGAAERVIVNAEMVKRDVMTRYGVAADRIQVIRNGVDLERFAPDADRAGARRRLGLDPDACVILFLGTGYGRKGLDRLLDALPAVRAARPDACLVVVGRDSAPAAWRLRVDRTGLRNAVHFLGERRDVEICYAAADVYALPTRYDAFANTTLEALASGRPVLTTDANGGGEILTDGVEGALLSEPVSAEAMLAALLDWTDPERAREGGRAARRLAERHSLARCMEESTKALEAVAAARRAA